MQPTLMVLPWQWPQAPPGGWGQGGASSEVVHAPFEGQHHCMGSQGGSLLYLDIHCLLDVPGEVQYMGGMQVYWIWTENKGH